MFDIPLLNAVVNVVLMFGITLFYDSGIKKRIWSVIFLYLITERIMSAVIRPLPRRCRTARSLV